MTLAVRLRPEAEQDLSDAAAWYEEQLSELGHQFLDEVLYIRRVHRRQIPRAPAIRTCAKRIRLASLSLRERE